MTATFCLAPSTACVLAASTCWPPWAWIPREISMFWESAKAPARTRWWSRGCWKIWWRAGSGRGVAACLSLMAARPCVRGLRPFMARPIRGSAVRGPTGGKVCGTLPKERRPGRRQLGGYGEKLPQAPRLQTALDTPSVLGRTERRTTGRQQERWIGCFHQELLATFNYEGDIILSQPQVEQFLSNLRATISGGGGYLLQIGKEQGSARTATISHPTRSEKQKIFETYSDTTTSSQVVRCSRKEES